MMNHAGANKVYLAAGITDMRKSIDGLAAIVSGSFSLDPFSTSLYVFCNRSRDKIKILRWDHNGFWLYYRRLEKGKFRWPKSDHTGVVAISRRELGWLLDGLEINQSRAHPPVTASTLY